MPHPPSFVYAGMDDDIVRLSDELKLLGGGDATSTNMDLYCFSNWNLKNQDQTLWTYDKSLGLRDVSLPSTTPRSESMKYYPTSGCCAAENGFTNTELMNDIVESSSSWVCNGFNSCILSIGMRNTLKTETLFGDIGMSSYNSLHPRNCFAYSMLQSLYHYSTINNQNMKTTIGISAWMLNGSQLIDLMVPVSTTKDPLDFVTIECPTLQIAMEVLHNARSKMSGCWVNSPVSDDMKQKEAFEREKGHFFFRVMMHQTPVGTPTKSYDQNYSTSSQSNSTLGTLSVLYIVDLVGFSQLDSNRYYKAFSSDTKMIIRDRNLQLTSLFQVLQEMHHISRVSNITSGNLSSEIYGDEVSPIVSTSSNAVQKPTSARNSKLTMLLAPIIQGNMKTSIFTFLKDGEKYGQDSKLIMNHVQGIPDISCACYRYQEVDLGLLQYRSYRDVLPQSTQKPTKSVSTATVGHRREQWDPLTNQTNAIYSPPPSKSSEEDHSQYSNANRSYRYSPCSTDYGDIDLDQILRDDFDPAAAAASRNKARTNHPSPNNQTNLPPSSSNQQVVPPHRQHQDDAYDEVYITRLMNAANNTSTISQEHLSSSVVFHPDTVPSTMNSLYVSRDQSMVGSSSTKPTSTTSKSSSSPVSSPSSLPISSNVQEIMNEFHSLIQTMQVDQNEGDQRGESDDPITPSQSHHHPVHPPSTTTTKHTMDSLTYSNHSSHSVHHHHQDVTFHSTKSPHPSSTSPFPFLRSSSPNDHDASGRMSTRKNSLSAASRKSHYEEEAEDGHEQGEAYRMDIEFDITVDSLESEDENKGEDSDEEEEVGRMPQNWTKRNEQSQRQRSPVSIPNRHQQKAMNKREKEEEEDEDSAMMLYDGIGGSTAIPLPNMIMDSGQWSREINLLDILNDSRLSKGSRGTIFTGITGMTGSIAATEHTEETDYKLPNAPPPTVSFHPSHGYAAKELGSSQNQQSFPRPPLPIAMSTNPSNPTKQTSSTANNLLNETVSTIDPLPPFDNFNNKQRTTDRDYNNKDFNTENAKLTTSSSSHPYIDQAISIKKLSLAQAYQEIEKLQRTKQSLLQVIHDTRQEKDVLEQKIQQQQENELEWKTQYEVEVDSYRYEMHQMKGQFKKLAQSIGMEDLYSICEQDIVRLSKENQSLRERNLQLEIQLLERNPTIAKGGSKQKQRAQQEQQQQRLSSDWPPHPVRSSMGTELTFPTMMSGMTKGTASTDHDEEEEEEEYEEYKNEATNANGKGVTYIDYQHRQEKTRLLTKLKQSGQERMYWKSLAESYKAKERQFQLQTKLLSDTTRRHKKLFFDYQQLKKASENQTRLFLEKDQEVTILQEQYASMEEMRITDRKERDEALRMLAWYKEQYQILVEERHRMMNLHKFIEKHSQENVSVSGKGMQQQQAAALKGILSNGNNRGRSRSRSHSPPRAPPSSYSSSSSRPRSISPYPPPPPPVLPPKSPRHMQSKSSSSTSSNNQNNNLMQRDALPRGYTSSSTSSSSPPPLPSTTPAYLTAHHKSNNNQQSQQQYRGHNSDAYQAREALLQGLQQQQHQQSQRQQPYRHASPHPGHHYHHEEEDEDDEEEAVEYRGTYDQQQQTRSSSFDNHEIVDNTLTSLHQALLQSSPALVPLVSKLSQHLHEERCHAVVAQVKKNQHQPFGSASTHSHHPLPPRPATKKPFQ